MLKTTPSRTVSLLTSLRSPVREQIRTTKILRRVVPPLVSKLWYKKPRLLTKENYIYVYDEITEKKKKPNIDVILTQFVEGLGNKWDVVSVRPFYGLSHLIVPGLALYATPENLKLREKMRGEKEDLGPVFSTRTSPVIIRMLKSTIIRLPMNRDRGWTVEPWHLRIALRQAGITVPEEAIELPETPITGPDYAGKENKVFLANIYVNKVDRGMIPFRIQHVGKAVRVDEGSEVPFEKLPVEALFPEQEATLQELFPAKFKPCQHSDTTTSPIKPTASS
ncbi:large ribosomal subunit protein bL9m [Dermacentor albipictus]|uniref:large ribosomal subunit protein bL9m n=1 Tax=Dermacentor albipictus TaxID=60249 RepID=UPI0031FE1C30